MGLISHFDYLIPEFNIAPRPASRMHLNSSCHFAHKIDISSQKENF